MSGAGRERHMAILDAIRRGDRTPDQLSSAINSVNKKNNLWTGFGSEVHFDKHVTTWCGWLVKEVIKANHSQEALGIDRFIVLKPNIPFIYLVSEVLPVQIKSSQALVEEFRADPRYKDNFSKKIIVINSNSDVSKSEFKDAFLKEIKRIYRLVEPQIG